jgi:uncharacterized membrane protein
MNAIEVHLRLNHFPIIGLIVLFILFIYAYFFKKKEIIIACKVGFVLLSLMSIAVSRSGEEAEELLEHKIGYNSEEMAEHEEHAEQAYVGILLLGTLSLISFFFKKNEKINSRFNAFIVPIGFVVILLMVITGINCGKIKHSELDGVTPTTQIEQEED